MVTLSPWWSPERHADRRPFLLARNRIKAAFRRYFETRGFTEVECAALQVSPGNEKHLHAFATTADTGGQTRQLYLHTSPEFASKKLLAAGESRIFDFARVFRNRESAALNVPEFTMLEWYRAHAAYDEVIADCVALIRLAGETAGQPAFRHRDRTVRVTTPARRMTVAEAFATYAGIDLLDTIEPTGPDRAYLAMQAQARGIRFDPTDTWSDIFSRILVEKVEPHLGFDAPLVLDQYPAAEAALARRCAHDPRVAERFEVYVLGVELANGFGELTDPVEQRARFLHEMDEKQRLYGERYPIDDDLLAALAHMPPAGGVALGFDRLVMLATGAAHIDQVMWTPPAGRTP